MKVSGKECPIYEMENKSNVPNHQPDEYHIPIVDGLEPITHY
jgi:hypothetical protein